MTLYVKWLNEVASLLASSSKCDLIKEALWVCLWLKMWSYEIMILYQPVYLSEACALLYILGLQPLKNQLSFNCIYHSQCSVVLVMMKFCDFQLLKVPINSWHISSNNNCLVAGNLLLMCLNMLGWYRKKAFLAWTRCDCVISSIYAYFDDLLCSGNMHIYTSELLLMEFKNAGALPKEAFYGDFIQEHIKVMILICQSWTMI